MNFAIPEDETQPESVSKSPTLSYKRKASEAVFQDLTL